MGLLHYTTTFNSTHGVQWTIEISGVSDSSGTGATFNTKGSGFDVSWQKGKHLRLPCIMPSTCKIYFLVENDTQKNSINTFFGADEGAYYIRIKKGAVLWWAGYIKPSYDSYQDMPFPYTATIKATDGLSRLNNKYNNSIQTSGALDFRKLHYPLQVFDDLFDIGTPVTSSYRYAIAYNWWHENQTYDANGIGIDNQYYNRNSFVEDNDNLPLVIKSYKEELEGVVKFMGCRLIFSRGVYYLIQEQELDADTLPVRFYDTPDSSTSPVNANTAIAYPISNSLPISATNSIIKKGASFTYDPELNSVRAGYVHGLGGVVFDLNLTYTSLTTIGFVGDTSQNYVLYPNLMYNENYLSSAVTPITTPVQHVKMSGRFVCKMKVGNYYWNGTEWTTADSTFNIDVGLGTEHPNVYGGTTYVNYDGYSTTNLDLAFIKAVDPIMMGNLPQYGEAQFMFTPTIYFWNANAPSNLTLQELIDAGTTYQNTSFNGVSPVQTAQSLQSSPHVTSFNPTFGSATGNETLGATYISSQNPATDLPDKNLGDIFLGTPGFDVDFSRGNVMYFDATDSIYKKAGNFRRGNTGIYQNPTRLLCKEYLSGQDKPMVILQGTIISTEYNAHGVFKYENIIGGSTDRYAFINGTFKAASDEWQGSWYKIDITGSPSYSDVIDNIDITPPPVIPNPITKQPTDATMSGARLAFDLGNVIANLTTAATTSAASVGKIFITAAVCEIKAGQKLLLSLPDGSNALPISATTGESQGSTDIDLTAVSASIDYPIGSRVIIKPNDLTNVITGGGGTPAGLNTQVQFNDGGAFGGDSGLTYNKSTDTLTTVNQLINNDLQILGGISGTLNLKNVSATGSPLLIFSQATTRRAFIQLADNFPTGNPNNLRIASEYGPVSISAASTSGSDSDTVYFKINPGGVFKFGADDSDAVLTTDGSMTFRIDADGDESSQKFSFQNNTSTEIANLDESGNLQIDGNLTIGGTSTSFATTYITRKTVLSTLDCNNLHTTPIQVAPAAGADKVLLPVGGMIRVDRAATQTNSASDINFHYANQEPGTIRETSLFHITRFMYNDTGDRVFTIAPISGSESSQNLTDDINKHLEISVTSALTINCFNSVTIYLTYNVIDIS